MPLGPDVMLDVYASARFSARQFTQHPEVAIAEIREVRPQR